MSNPCANTSALKAYERIQAMQEIEQEILDQKAEVLFKEYVKDASWFTAYMEDSYMSSKAFDTFATFFLDEDDFIACEALRKAYHAWLWDEAMKEAPDYL